MTRGRGTTRTHADKRQGTTTLSAARGMTAGIVISQRMRRHRAVEVIRGRRLSISTATSSRTRAATPSEH